MRVAFQGERGAYSEEAISLLFPDAEVTPRASLADVFDAVARAVAERAVVPVENSQAGSINETYDLLLAHSLFITSELDLRIRHCLLALPGQVLTDIKTVYSHPQALAQCEEFLRRHGCEAVPAYDTAGSAKQVAERHAPGTAAIAGRRAAEIYGLQVVAEGIETNPYNYTKFLALSPAPVLGPPAGPGDAPWRSWKTSIVFTTENAPGALYKALGAFALRGLNLTKLESRPRRDVPWEYLFYVDFDGHQDEPAAADALADLARVCVFLRVLGSYPKSPPLS